MCSSDLGSSCVGTVCTWTVTIALPEGADYQYKFIKRNDCATCYGDPGNVVWGSYGDTQASTPAGPPAPYAGKTIFYYSGWSTVSLLYSNTLTGSWTFQAMSPVSNGLWRADGINRPGETNLFFVFTDNQGNWDNPDGIAGYNYQTPLDAFVVRNGHVFNYWPPAFVSTNRVETFFMQPNNGLKGRTIRVYLPRGYTENTTKRYPVLYMHDGANIFLGMGTYGCWNTDTNANNLIRFGNMRETIIVGVDQTSDRYNEYLPPDCTDGWGDDYAAFLINQLKPYIDATYRTLTDADNTGALGSSMGGLISTYLGWEFPGTFRKIGAFSTAFWLCEVTKNKLDDPPKRPIRIYLDSGDTGDFTNDGLALTVEARDNLIRNGYVFNIDLDHVIGYGHNHNEYWWDRRLPRALQFLFPTSDEPNTVLDSVAPMQITNYQIAGGSNVVTWTSYRLRTYTLQGITNESLPASITWSNVFTTAPEARFWNYPTSGVFTNFHFLRVRQDTVPNWPN